MGYADICVRRCGPRKLAKVLSHSLRRAEEARLHRETNGEPTEPNSKELEEAAPPASAENPLAPEMKREATVNPDDLGKTMSAAISYPSPPPINPATPSLQNLKVGSEPGQAADLGRSALHVLLVDDNKINRQLLVMFMKKSSFSYAEAENGQEALDLYKSSCLPGPLTSPSNPDPTRRFDFVLMDISMPVMDGMEATKRIREFEKENGLQRTNVIALTGLASKDAQVEAESVGVDVFLPKPVRFAELKKLLAASTQAERK